MHGAASRGARSALELDGAEPFDPMGTGAVMKDSIFMPEPIFDEPNELRDWLHRALQFTATLPPKVKKAKVAKPAKAEPAAKAATPAKAKPAARPAKAKPAARPTKAKPAAKPAKKPAAKKPAAKKSPAKKSKR